MNYRVYIFLTVLAGTFLMPSLRAQTLFTLGNSQVSKDEFLRAYNKNNQDKKKTEASIREYLELFIRFKLKVKEAYAQKLDTLSNQKAELLDFRNQLAENFLKDDARFQQLLQEAFKRSQQDIHLSHLFIPASSAAQQGRGQTTSDTMAAYRRAMAAFDELRQGADFSNIVMKYAGDSLSKATRGDIGFITVFTLPYDIENLVYSLPVGGVSRPLLLGSGYHIFKNTGVRAAVGRLRLRQALVTIPASADMMLKAALRRTADSISKALSDGEPFEKVTQRFWNNGLTSGELPEFGVGSYQPSFEAAAFALTKNGSVSPPIETALGFHVLQRIDGEPVNTDEGNESAMQRLKQRLMNDSRMEMSRRELLAKIYNAIQLKPVDVNIPVLARYADSSLKGGKNLTISGINDKTILFSIAGKNITAADWLQTLRAARRTSLPSEKEATVWLQQFQETSAFNYYREHLEKYEPTFAAQLAEFKEGNLLFEIMQRTLWDKAASDSIQLKKYFTQHIDKYWWESGAAALIFNTPDSAVATALYAAVKTQPGKWRSAAEPYGEKIQADSGRFEMDQLIIESPAMLKAGTITPVKKSKENNSFYFSYIIQEFPGREKRSFEDARGFVINDYQSFLEGQWIKDLKKKYPVKVNETVLKTVL